MNRTRTLGNPLLVAFAMATMSIFAHAGELLTNQQFVGIEKGKPVSNFRRDGCVRFDPYGPKPHFDAPQTSGEPASGQTYVLPLGGDVDGDGVPDVLQVEVSFDEQFSPFASVFIARSGKNGRELWRAQLGAGIFWGGYLPGDATGDGRPDLAFTTEEDIQVLASWPPPDVSCFECFKWVLTAKTRLLLLDGANGQFRWQDERQVVWAFQEEPAPQDVTLIKNSVYTSLLSAFTALGDVNGDGGREILWTPWTSIYTQALAAQSTQTAEVIAYVGATGEHLWNFQLRGAGASPWNSDTTALAGAWSGPDGTGDGTPDVYTSEIIETPVETVLNRKGINGLTGEQFWSQSRNWVSDARLLSADYLPLAGGALIYTLTANNFRSDLESINPATGDVQWAQLDWPAIFALPAGDVNRDGHEDLACFGYDQGANTVDVESLDGVTGQRMSRRIISLDSFSWIYAPAPFLDHSGDGVVDPLLFGGSSTGGVIDEQVTITDLTSGRELWGGTRSGDVPTYWAPASDFGGNGYADVVAVRMHDRWNDPRPRIELSAFSGVDGHDLWQNDSYRTGPSGETVWQVYVGFMRDENGTGGRDFQLSSWNLYNSWAINFIVPQVDLLEGSTGKVDVRLLGSPLMGVASRKVHSSAGTYDVDLTSGGVECRSGGANGDYTLVFTLANPLASVGGATVTSGTGTVKDGTVGSDAHQYIVNLTGVTNAQRITVGLTNVTDSADNFSSAVSAQMGVLVGDVNGNGLVNSTDTSLVQSQSGQGVTASNFRMDVNANALINSTDTSIVQSKSGTGLP